MAEASTQKYLIICDEGTYTFRKSQDYDSSGTQNVLQEIALEAPKFGIHLIVATQVPDLLSEVAKSFGTKISFVLGSDSAKAMYGPLRLNTRDKQEALGKLPKRTFIINRRSAFPNPVRGYSTLWIVRSKRYPWTSRIE